jgi:hypothetical protein
MRSSSKRRDERNSSVNSCSTRGFAGEPRKLSTIQRPAATDRLKEPSAINGAANQGTGSPKTIAQRSTLLSMMALSVAGRYEGDLALHHSASW